MSGPRDSTNVAGQYNLVCYYSSWASDRAYPMDFDVEDIDPHSCTHLIFAFAGIDPSTHEIVSLDPEEDVVGGRFKAAVELREENRELKVLIGVGGWNEGGKKYSKMAKKASRRKRFIDSVMAFLREHDFDGLDFNWQYPGAADRDGKWHDKYAENKVEFASY